MADENYSIIISEHVRSRMEEHICFLANINPTAAEKLIDTFIKDIGSLHTFPQRNPRYESSFLTGEYRFMMCAERYRIIYLVDDQTIYVDEIYNCRIGE